MGAAGTQCIPSIGISWFPCPIAHGSANPIKSRKSPIYWLALLILHKGESLNMKQQNTCGEKKLSNFSTLSLTLRPFSVQAFKRERERMPRNGEPIRSCLIHAVCQSDPPGVLHCLLAPEPGGDRRGATQDGQRASEIPV